jgi:hypothetical protein
MNKTRKTNPDPKTCCHANKIELSDGVKVCTHCTAVLK